MTIDKMIDDLVQIRDEIGGDHEVAVVRIGCGENDYIIPDYGICGNFTDQNGNNFKCAFLGKTGGSKFVEK